MKYSLPLRCGMPLHDFSSTDEGIVIVSPSRRVVIQKKLDQLLCSASGVILSNDLEKEVRRSPNCHHTDFLYLGGCAKQDDAVCILTYSGAGSVSSSHLP